jgi:hypothetical protein
MKYVTALLLLVVAVSGPVRAQDPIPSPVGYVPQNGFAPDEGTATAIAEAVLIPIFGEKTIRQEEPFSASLSLGVWTVKGTMPKAYNVGGVAVVKLRKSDACILFVSHGK